MEAVASTVSSGGGGGGGGGCSTHHPKIYYLDFISFLGVEGF